MANFNSLLQSTAFEAPKPKIFPPGIGYKGVLQQPRMGERAMQGEDKLIVSFPIKATEWPTSGVSEGEMEGLSLQGKVFTKDFILDKKKLENEDKSELWPLDQLLRSLGVSGGATYEELLPECAGKEVEFSMGVREYKGTDGEMEKVNTVKKVIGV